MVQCHDKPLVINDKKNNYNKNLGLPCNKEHCGEMLILWNIDINPISSSLVSVVGLPLGLGLEPSGLPLGLGLEPLGLDYNTEFSFRERGIFHTQILIQRDMRLLRNVKEKKKPKT